MISMQGVPSALIARNESWVRKQAGALARRLPSNIERADLIQVGLIAVAQASLAFTWEGDHESEDAKQAFVRYARMRVKGAMLDELRQMDHLGRAERRKVKVIQIARERWRAAHGVNPGLLELSGVCGMGVSEIAQLEQAARLAQTESLTEDADAPERVATRHPATAQDEVEARVDTAIVMRRLEKYFATLPPRDRQVIDSYLGVGMTPVELAGELKVSPSRVSQLYKALCERISEHFGHTEQRAVGRMGQDEAKRFEVMVTQRESELSVSPEAGAWGTLMEDALTLPSERFVGGPASPRLAVQSGTLWL